MESLSFATGPAGFDYIWYFKATELTSTMIPEPYQKAIQERLNALTLQVNDKILSIIDEEHLDPLTATVSEKKSVAGADIIVCITRTDSEMTLKNLRGLSSLAVDQIAFQNGMGGMGNTIDMSAFIYASLSKPLTVEASGNISGHCGEVGHSIDYNGSASIASASFTIAVGFEITVNGDDMSFTKYRMITDAAAPSPLVPVPTRFGAVSATLNDMGIFDKLRPILEQNVAKLMETGYEERMLGGIIQLLDKALADIIENK